MSLRLLVSFVSMYLAVFSKTCCPASGPGRPHSASPLGRRTPTLGSSAHSVPFVHIRTPFPIARTHTFFQNYPYPCSLFPRALILSVHPIHLAIHKPNPIQHNSVVSLSLLLYTQLPSSHIHLLPICLPLCNSRCSTLQFNSDFCNLPACSTSLSDLGSGVPESPRYLPLIPTA